MSEAPPPLSSENPEPGVQEQSLGSGLGGCAMGCCVQIIIVVGTLICGPGNAVMRGLLFTQWLLLAVPAVLTYRAGKKDTCAGLLVSAMIGALVGTACATSRSWNTSG